MVTAIIKIALFLCSTSAISSDISLQGPLKVKVTPNSPTSATENIRFAPDPRGQNGIITSDEGIDKWRIVSKLGNQLLDWPLTLALDANTYGFEPNKQDSAVAITMRGFCELTSECDAFFSVSIGNKYFSFATDFDGAITTGNQLGIQIYPACQTQLATGDPTNFLSSVTPGSAMNMWYGLRSVLAGGDRNNWDVIKTTSTHNGENFPVTFELVNNDIDDSFIVRFGSPKFRKGQIQCKYNGAVDTNAEIKMFMTNDWPNNADETIVIRSFVINGNRYRRSEDEDVIINNANLVQYKHAKTKDGVNINDKIVMEGIVLIMLLIIIGFIVKRYYFDNSEIKRLGQETSPLLINVQ
eukprot:CAMPEP_0201578628 /NCGR_PEP_ID=MMETSP0190_2-20130828/25598_1 /ASSEMBLY_ACC=CAM_ASM_000263 /TAXON_ID=37353 /ORGANISM="Rosalina sp." /LENGTH=353 /DNA_ID=CAMNT_0048012025 /DNA_START=27 /DNA_END=1088 /DNA_ORIENTATION=-